jgi:predicted heme/steroid binding protein
MAIDGTVYDVTRFVQFHPGGVKIMEKYGGRDVTDEYRSNHLRLDPQKVVGNCRVGVLENGSLSSSCGQSSGCQPQEQRELTEEDALREIFTSLDAHRQGVLPRECVITFIESLGGHSHRDEVNVREMPDFFSFHAFVKAVKSIS